MWVDATWMLIEVLVLKYMNAYRSVGVEIDAY